MTGMDAAGSVSPSDTAGRHRFPALAASVMALFGIGAVVWMLLDSMNPPTDSPAPLFVDLHQIPVGHRKTIHWNWTPIFVVHRTPEEIAAARAGDDADLPFPEPDADRVRRGEWLVVVGLDTFRGWGLLTGQAASADRGEWDGWRWRGEGIAYDTSGRLRRGPGCSNLIVPAYEFVSDTRIEFVWPVVEHPYRVC